MLTQTVLMMGWAQEGRLVTRLIEREQKISIGVISSLANTTIKGVAPI